MKYEQFVNAMSECVKKLASDSELVEKQEILKNNGVVAVGISVRNKAAETAPVIYLEDYFKLWCKGAEIKELAAHLVEKCREAPPVPVWEYQNILDFSKVERLIVFKLVNARRNERLLKEVPNLPLMDLAVVFYVMIPTDTEESCSVLVRNVHMNYWKLSFNRLLECAKENTPRLCPYVYRPLSELVELYTGEGLPACPLMLLTNETGMNGAAVIVYPGLLKTIYEEEGGAYYLLPSSIHEFLVLPDQGNHSPEELRRIVQEVNREHLAAEELLSDHIYRFDGEVITKM